MNKAHKNPLVLQALLLLTMVLSQVGLSSVHARETIQQASVTICEIHSNGRIQAKQVKPRFLEKLIAQYPLRYFEPDTFYLDDDADGFGDVASPTAKSHCQIPFGFVYDDGDCNDRNSRINPGATEIPGNRVDENCDGVIAVAKEFRQVFVTSTAHSALLGGLKGADEICQRLADNNTDTVQIGRYVAWMSDTKTNASERLDHANVPYRRADGVDIAHNYADLTDGNLLFPLNVNEEGMAVAPTNVWTGTDIKGTHYVVTNFGVPVHCSAWSSDTIYGMEVIGNVSQTDRHWTGAAVGGGSASSWCLTKRPLYCMESYAPAQ